VKKFVLSPLFMAVPLLAQESAPRSDDIEEITVTATRSSHPLSELGSSVIVLDRDEIEARGARDLGSLLRGLAGFSIRKSGSLGGNTDVSIRGAKPESTLLIIDGVKVGDASSIGGNLDFGSLQLDDVERIEIVKGPHSVAFASSGMSGAIHVITRKNRLGQHGKIGLGVGSFQTFRQTLEYQIGREQWDLGLQWSALQSKGFSSAGNVDEAEKDPFERQDYQARLGWQPREGFEGRLLVKQGDSRVDIDAGAGDDDPNYRVLTYEQLLSLQQDLGQYGAWTPSLQIAQNRVRRRYLNDIDPAHPADFNRDRFISRTQQGEFNNSLNLGETTHLFVNATWLKEEADLVNQGAFAGNVFQEETEGLSREEQSMGLLFDTAWSERVFLQIGARQLDSQDFSPTQVGQLATAVHLVPEASILRLQYSRGYKTPSLFQLYSRYGNKQLEAERVLHQEVGLEQRWQSVSVELKTFRDLYDNLIDFVQDRYRNARRVEIKGQEFSARYALADSWTLEGQYTQLDSRDLELDVPLANRPRDLFAASLQYTVDDWSWHTAVRGQGRSPGGISAKGTQGFNVLDTNLAYFVADYRLDVKIENLADRTYEEIAGYNAPRRAFQASGEYRF
jgi:vitamin B12 transporter